MNLGIVVLKKVKLDLCGEKMRSGSDELSTQHNIVTLPRCHFYHVCHCSVEWVGHYN